MSFMTMLSRKFQLPGRAEALPGRDTAIVPSAPHAVTGRALLPPYPDGLRELCVGMGCFWGAERLFWQIQGVHVTAVGYAGGFTPNPTYNETCTGRTGHAEVVRIVYDPVAVSLEDLLAVFWENHDPTQGMRQGNDTGTQYRSVLYLTDPDDLETARKSLANFQERIAASGRRNTITTEIAPQGDFYFAEDYHQQYLAKNPGGYCGLKGMGV